MAEERAVTRVTGRHSFRERRVSAWCHPALITVGVMLLTTPARTAGVHFTEVGVSAGVSAGFGYQTRIPTSAQMIAGGVAAGDFDGDGLVDLFVVRGAAGPARLLRNRGGGMFEDVAANADVAFFDSLAVGPLFFDADGDGRPDLFIGSIQGGPIRLLHNVDGERFEDVTSASGLQASGNTFGASAGDFDGDGYLDLFNGHWGSPPGECHLWRNLGGLRFVCVDAAAGLSDLVRGTIDHTFTGNFADIDGDGLPDLLATSDFGTSRVFLQEPGAHFRDVTGPEINDENGMGSAIGDYDGDGRLDWFVSSVWDPDGFAEGVWGVHGNRLYRNLGEGHFADVTDHAGVRYGYWGWAASFADLDNDGHLDLIHVNGFQRSAPEFHADPTRLFMSNGDGTFTEGALESGLADSAQGRGVVVFDADGDGDLDVFIANNGQPATLWQNDSDHASGWLEVECRGRPPNTQGIGARVYVTANGLTRSASSAGNQLPFAGSLARALRPGPCASRDDAARGVARRHHLEARRRGRRPASGRDTSPGAAARHDPVRAAQSVPGRCAVAGAHARSERRDCACGRPRRAYPADACAWGRAALPRVGWQR
jgi:hypothetical protein